MRVRRVLNLPYAHCFCLRLCCCCCRCGLSLSRNNRLFQGGGMDMFGGGDEGKREGGHAVWLEIGCVVLIHFGASKQIVACIGCSAFSLCKVVSSSQRRSSTLFRYISLTRILPSPHPHLIPMSPHCFALRWRRLLNDLSDPRVEGPPSFCARAKPGLFRGSGG